MVCGMFHYVANDTHLNICQDHVGSGFHRYSTDKNWHVPHFEKMLYDQAQLLLTYTRAYQLTGNEDFASVMNDIVVYVQDNLLAPEGAFYAAEDADSLPLPDSTEKKGKDKISKGNHGLMCHDRGCILRMGSQRNRKFARKGRCRSL